MNKDARRSVLEAIYLQIGIRLRYFITQWMGLKALFLGLTAYSSPCRPTKAPKYDFVTRASFVALWFILGLTREPNGAPIFYPLMVKIGVIPLLNRWQAWLTERLIKQMQDDGYTSAEREVPIPSYDWEKGNAEEFYETFVKKPHPVILKGFMKGSDLVKKMSFENIVNRFGEEDVFLTRPELDGIQGKLKEVDTIPKTYLHNSEILFNKYPELRDLFQYERLEGYLHMKVGYEQLFIGKEGTGTPFHSASVYNMFYQIDGVKRWWFVDPYDTILGYPVAAMGRGASILCCLWPHEYNVEAFPLFKYCPVYTADLEPGDVLFNPPWWWHAIKNVTEHSVGVASRWHTDGIAGHNFVATEEDYDIARWSSLQFFAGLASIPFLHEILQTPSPRYDEHLTLREVKNRFVHKQLEISKKGGIEYNGVMVKG